MNTREGAIETLTSRIDTAKRVIKLFREQLDGDPFTAFYIMHKEAVMAAQYIRVFESLKRSLENNDETVEQLVDMTRRELKNLTVSQHFLTAQPLYAIENQCFIVAKAEALEILTGE